MPLIMGILAQGVGAAPGGAGAYDLLETQTLGTDAASVTFTGLGSYSNYKHLQIRAVAKRSLSDAGTASLAVRFNSANTNYAKHALQGDVLSVTSDSQTSQVRINIQATLVGSGAGAANIFSPYVIDILDFSSTNKNTTLRALAGNTSGTDDIVTLASGLWADTSAVTEIEFFQPTSDLVTGSRFSLYGVK